ncbi:MAG: DUF4132 domain-containing protein [Candidatus Pseudobacter hemicellulosilyticus]|uniref:DUF4132 domain-containing protein n=1 Tax=Candidatus Pseudobacter hemicellulosilyticus TaxID=3121375 RepID=A0AAJ5WRQ7_9BACT|nr:MAG: DUF4132 domain-containing protein [Pseudobacter sp.]
MEQSPVKQYLENKIIPDFYKQLKARLARELDGGDGAGSLSPAAAELGLLLINERAGMQQLGTGNTDAPAYGADRFNRIRELLGEAEWNNPSNYALLPFIFGNEKAALIKYAWEQVPDQMYQVGYTRRSFRSPANKELYLPNQISFLISSIPQAYSRGWDAGYNVITKQYDLDLQEQIRYDFAMGDNNASLFRLWSAAIDLAYPGVYEQLEAIIFNKDEVGKVTRTIIKALLNSQKQEAWELVEKLLLAAQRQEGLRQTILEALDETSTGALKYMIKVIIDNDLARFSSVVRAVDVWAGMGWESERETTVRSFLEKAYKYLDNPALIPQAMTDSNNAEVYMALWAQGVFDVEETIPYLQQLMTTGNTEKRTLALIFAAQTAHYRIQLPFLVQGLADTEIPPLACAVNFIKQLLIHDHSSQYIKANYPDLFQQLHERYQQVTTKEKKFAGYVFAWLTIEFNRKDILWSMLQLVDNSQERLNTVTGYFEEMDAFLKRALTRIILSKHSDYRYRADKQADLPLTPFQRSYALLILKDRSEFDIACAALQPFPLTADEVRNFPDYFKRKAADFRSRLISLLLLQEDSILFPVVEQILLQGDIEQRLAGLDILVQLHKAGRFAEAITGWVAQFRERKTVSQKEAILLAQLSESNEATYSAENGYGLYDPSRLTPVVAPVIDPDSLYEQAFALQEYGFSQPLSHIREAFVDLEKLHHAHRDHEYQVTYWNNTTETVLLGNQFHRSDYTKEYSSDRERYEAYPFHALWEAWFIQWKLQPQDLCILFHASKLMYGHYPEAMSSQLPRIKDIMPAKSVNFNSPLFRIAETLQLIYPLAQSNEWHIGAATRLFASLDEKELKKDKDPNSYSVFQGWQQISSLHLFSGAINLLTLDTKQLQQCWLLYNWRQYSGLPQNARYHIPPLQLFCRAFEAGVIGKDELYRGLLHPEHIKLVSTLKKHKHEFDYMGTFPFLLEPFNQIRDRILDVELKRGDSPTPVTAMAAALKRIYGISRLGELLAGLGKTSLYKGYFYSWGEQDQLNKQSSFSHLLKNCYPLDTDNQQLFDQTMQAKEISGNRLIEAAMYAPQWQKFVSNYLGWKGLDNAIWWMHAHTKTDAYEEKTAEAESEIARYSTVDLKEFKDGAVDKDWFHRAYKEIGKDRWPIIYEAAKYISDGNGHRRARIYADALLGNLTLKEITEKVTDKRDQDHLRIYGLVPLGKAKAMKEVLERYEYIQQFKKGSSQFGAQKQASEARAIQMAMENLARNAGYPDPIRLTWAMETRQVQQILSKQTQVRYEDVLIGLVIDEEGQADVVAFKGDNPLKAIPAKFRKDKKVEELNGYKKTLREQYNRARRGLEEAMVRGDQFQPEEIKALFAHPVISRHLEKLVLIVDAAGKTGSHGFYRDGALFDGTQEFPLSSKDQLRIAHCIDLYKTGSWSVYQRYAFDHQLKQPFRQLFRELYLPTQDELSEKSVSRRYAGHQVQPRQTAALLKSRGWKADYETGLQKVFHKEGFVAKLYALADWLTPSEVENPTLETIAFHDLKTYKNVAFTDIDGRIFSEVMRDIDLVVSIAHAGAVDAEASHSSIEMRAVLLQETLRLFRISNVEIAGSHAKIRGKLGEYSVHLGSAVAHSMGAGYLSIIPVHAQQRGRLFLPFVDDDPKSAELMAKVLLLAKDDEIQDPTILQQLR